MTQSEVLVMRSPLTLGHDPVHEVWVGVATSAAEVAARVDVFLSALADILWWRRARHPTRCSRWRTTRPS
jgi:hypothetical protein